MKPIDPEELSALLDGELPEPRSEEVRRALEQDPVLREEYERFVAFDADWKREAQAARFRPRVRIPVASRRWKIPVAGLVLALAAFRLLIKTLPPIPGGLIEAAALVIVLGWGVRYLVRLSEPEWIASKRPSTI